MSTSDTYAVQAIRGRNATDAAAEGLRLRKIAEAAYYKSEQRGFTPCRELDDWLEAEREIDGASRPLPSY